MLQIGQPAPFFEGKALLPRENLFSQLSLNQYRGRYVILLFYPHDFTFVCPTEIISFSDRQIEFNAINTQVIGISCDSSFSHLAWTKLSRSQGGLGLMNIPLVSDFDKNISNTYGVLLPNGVPVRALCIIDAQGVLRQLSFNDHPVGRDVSEVIRLVKAFQFTDIYGEVCPANWNPGDPTIRPDIHGSKEYFISHGHKNKMDDDSNLHDTIPSSAEPESLRVEDSSDSVTRIEFQNLPLATTDHSLSDLSLTADQRGSYKIFSAMSGFFSTYQQLLKNHPLRTKAITSCVIALLGELIGSYVKRRAEKNQGKHPLPLINYRRLGIFGAYGLAITGPTFHWWYGTLERFVAKQQLPPRISIVFKIMLDRLVLTPPFLLFSLGFLQYFQNLSASQTITNVKNAYAAALFTNWRVWTVAQGINFSYVPLDYRVLFGNIVALWWNVYLSMAS